MADEFGYKVGESDRATDQECKARGIKKSDTNNDKKRADASEVERKKFLAATFLLGEDRHQYGGMITQLRSDCTKVQQT